MTETELSREIRTALEQAGCIVVRVQSGQIRTGKRVIRCADAGTPDLCVLAPGGLTTWLEIKTQEGAASAQQLCYHVLMRNLGHRVAVARSVDYALAICFGGAL